MQLSNQVAVITGGTSGIDLASAKLFASEGARVITFSRQDSDAARQAVGKVGEQVSSITQLPSAAHTSSMRPRERTAKSSLRPVVSRRFAWDCTAPRRRLRRRSACPRYTMQCVLLSFRFPERVRRRILLQRLRAGVS